MEKQSRRKFLGLAVGAILAKGVKPISPPAYVPWFIRAQKTPWRPTPLTAAMSDFEIVEFQRSFEAYWASLPRIDLKF